MCGIDTTTAIEILRNRNIEIGLDPRTPTKIVCDMALIECVTIENVDNAVIEDRL